LVPTNPEHRPIIQSCVLNWQKITDNRRNHLRILLDRFEQLDRQVQVKVQAHRDWSHLREPLKIVIGNTKQTSKELLTARMSLRFWTDVSQGKAEVRYPTGQLSDSDRAHVFRHLPPAYNTQLRAEINHLPKLRRNLAVFRNL
jgi:hypothetical protein